MDAMIVCGGVAAVYCKFMPGKSSQLRRFLREQHVTPAETHELSDYVLDDSPEDVGLFISGTFSPVREILTYPKDFAYTLRLEKQRGLERAAQQHNL